MKYLVIWYLTFSMKKIKSVEELEKELLRYEKIIEKQKSSLSEKDKEIDNYKNQVDEIFQTNAMVRVAKKSPIKLDSLKSLNIKLEEDVAKIAEYLLDNPCFYKGELSISVALQMIKFSRYNAYLKAIFSFPDNPKVNELLKDKYFFIKYFRYYNTKKKLDIFLSQKLNEKEISFILQRLTKSGAIFIFGLKLETSHDYLLDYILTRQKAIGYDLNKGDIINTLSISEMFFTLNILSGIKRLYLVNPEDFLKGNLIKRDITEDVRTFKFLKKINHSLFVFGLFILFVATAYLFIMPNDPSIKTWDQFTDFMPFHFFLMLGAGGSLILIDKLTSVYLLGRYRLKYHFLDKKRVKSITHNQVKSLDKNN